MSKISKELEQAATVANLTPRAAHLLRNFFLKLATQEEKDELDIWMNESEANSHLFDLLLDANIDGTGAGTMHLLIKKAKKEPRKRNIIFKILGWGVVAIIVLTMIDIFIPGRIVSRLTTNDELKQISWKKITVETGDQPKTIWLADSTRVDLMPHSSMYFPEDFYFYDRLVKLKGSAKFDVRYMNREPFRVELEGVYAQSVKGAFSLQNDSIAKRIVLDVSRKNVLFGYDKNNNWSLEEGEKGIYENGTIHLERPGQSRANESSQPPTSQSPTTQAPANQSPPEK